TRYQRAIRDLVDERWIQIIPLLNPSGLQWTVFGQTGSARLWRKNRARLPHDADAWEAALGGADAPNSPFRNVGIVNGKCEYEVPHYSGPRRITPTPAVEWRTQTLPTGKVGVDLNRNYPTSAWGYEGRP